jgi:membrane protein DedA with SNARE-associated domain
MDAGATGLPADIGTMTSGRRMDSLQPYLDFFAANLYLFVFLCSLIDATGFPFPGRIMLIVAGTVASDDREVVTIVALGAAGAVTGDHALYLAGMLGGPRLLALYCRLTFSPPQCLDQTVAYFRRLGLLAIVMGRFSTSVRLFAAVMAGSGHLPYARFLAYDLVGALSYAGLWVLTGYVFGDQARAVLQRLGGPRLLLLIAPVAIVAIVAFRLWQRARRQAGPPS